MESTLWFTYPPRVAVRVERGDADMIALDPHDEDLHGFRGVVLPSSTRGVSFRLDRALGAGGMGTAFFALRLAPDGEGPAVVKILHPTFVRESGHSAWLAVHKEVVALRRLNERVPSTPFVVRFLDTGTVRVQFGHDVLDLPWVALEYVHGGFEGTTVDARVRQSVHSSGFAFDPARVARALECLAAGVSAIHEVGVIHRDLKPENVLCCGFGEDEILKITDFGVARPVGIAATFGNCIIGTPGYASPEQSSLDQTHIGPWTDVFALGAITYFLLTGEDYFQPRTLAEALVLVRSPERRPLRSSRALSPELAADDAMCAAIDLALARATAHKPAERPPSAELFAAMVLPYLRGDSRQVRASSRSLNTLMSLAQSQTAFGGWTWNVLQRPGGSGVLRSVAWNSDGRCLGATSSGLAFWDGTCWVEAPLEGFPEPSGIRFVQRVAPGKWLVGGDNATLASYATRGVRDVVRGADPAVSLVHASGDYQDLAVLVGERTNDTPLLFSLAARRWLRPRALHDAQSVTSLARVHDERWLVTGRGRDGAGYVVDYAPLQGDLTPLRVPHVRAFLAAAGQLDRGIAVIGGTGGVALWYDGENVTAESVGADVDLSAVVVDVGGRAWAASTGALWCRHGERNAAWRCVWRDPTWTSPIISLFADLGLVMAVTADGGVLEGRMDVCPG